MKYMFPDITKTNEFFGRTIRVHAVCTMGGAVSDLLCVAGLGEPVLVQLQAPDPPRKIVAGKDVILRCSVDGSGDIHIEWYR
jgi:hypothetical protein